MSSRFADRMITIAMVMCALSSAQVAMAQHEQHNPSEPAKDTTSTKPTQPDRTREQPKVDQSDQHTHSAPTSEPSNNNAGNMAMPGTLSALVPGVPHEREGSGTSWLPDNSPVHALHWQRDHWALMLHGAASLRYTIQDVSDAGDRGADALSAPNWGMLMAMRPVGHTGQITLRGMMSLDRLTEGGDGYPLLFQTGESWEDQPLVDRQHPHDLFMELAAAYGRSTGENNGYFVYFGLPGEPALGPPAFMHRPSSRSNVEAPLGHHWQDATHISFGVLTGGYIHKSIKLDASVFTGREPDEDRWGFDQPKFDSYAGRISYNPSDRYSLQFSGGRLNSPEMLEPDVDLTRVTASVLSHHPLNDQNQWNTAIVWGMNDPSEGMAQHSFLVESEREGNVLSPFGRLEIVQKSGHDLQISSAGDELFNVGAMTFGVEVAVPIVQNWRSSVGIQGTAYRVPEGLQSEYGENPWSVGMQIQVSPARAMTHSSGTH